MDSGLVDQQKGAESSASGTTLSAQQFYQHDPLLVLLKDTWHLNDFWVIAGVMVPPGGVYLLWWFWGEYVVKVQHPMRTFCSEWWLGRIEVGGRQQP